MAYIANKPLRVGGQNFVIGESIPDELIEPKMVARLIGWGKILKVDLPSEPKPIPEFEHLDPAGLEDWTEEQLRALATDIGLELNDDHDRDLIITMIATVDLLPDDKANIDISKYTAEGGETPSTGETNGDSMTDEGAAAVAPADGTEPFKCPDCGKVCATKTALTAHQKTHNR